MLYIVLNFSALHADKRSLKLFKTSTRAFQKKKAVCVGQAKALSRITLISQLLAKWQQALGTAVWSALK